MDSASNKLDEAVRSEEAAKAVSGLEAKYASHRRSQKLEDGTCGDQGRGVPRLGRARGGARAYPGDRDAVARRREPDPIGTCSTRTCVGMWRSPSRTPR